MDNTKEPGIEEENSSEAKAAGCEIVPANSMRGLYEDVLRSRSEDKAETVKKLLKSKIAVVEELHAAYTAAKESLDALLEMTPEDAYELLRSTPPNCSVDIPGANKSYITDSLRARAQATAYIRAYGSGSGGGAF